MPAEGSVLPGDTLDGVVDAVGDGLAHTLHRIAHLSCAAIAAESKRELRGEEFDLPANGIGTLQIPPVTGFLQLGSKVAEPRAVLTPRARIEDFARVYISPLVRQILSAVLYPRKLGPSLVTECSELKNMKLLLGMEQQMLEVDETPQAGSGDPRPFVGDAPEITLATNYRYTR